MSDRMNRISRREIIARMIAEDGSYSDPAVKILTAIGDFMDYDFDEKSDLDNALQLTDEILYIMKKEGVYW